MFVQMNLRLSGELLRLAEYLHSMKGNHVDLKELIDLGFTEAYVLCEYLDHTGFVDYQYSDVLVFPDYRDSMLNHANDLVSLYSDLEHDRQLANRERDKNIKYGKRGFRIALAAIIVSVLTLIWQIVKDRGWI